MKGLQGGGAAFERAERVEETHEGDTLSEGDVYAFAIKGGPAAKHCYAWSESVPGSKRRRFCDVLHAKNVKRAPLAV